MLKRRKSKIEKKCIKLIREIYSLHMAGGYLHIVLDDLNVSNSNIRFCIKSMSKDKDPILENVNDDLTLRKLCKKTGKILLKFTERERASIIKGAVDKVDIDVGLGRAYPIRIIKWTE